MAGRKKYSVRVHRGSMCNICGQNCGKGGGLRSHIESTHEIDFATYRICFPLNDKKTLIDAWNDDTNTKKGNKFYIHVLVRRFIQEPTKRGARVK